jgi:acyl-CoA thioester hydrolase
MAAAFRFDVELPVRYRDLDTLGHVNSTVYATYLEQARLEYFGEVLKVPFEERELVLASLDVEYHSPVTLEADTVRVACRVVDIGTSSFEMAYRAYGDEEAPAATGETTLVAWDGDGPRPIPEAWRSRFRSFEPSL